MPDSRISDEILEKALEAFYNRPMFEWADEGMRAALEAVWPEPTFTPEEIEILLDVMDEAFYKDERRDLCVKLEAMRDA